MAEPGHEDDQAMKLARRCAEAMRNDAAASAGLGMRLRWVTPGYARVTTAARKQMVNGHGIVHGGLVATLADSAFAVACNTYGDVTVAAGFDIVFMAPSRLGDELTAEAVERVRSGRSGPYDVSVRATDPASQVRLVAELRGRSRSLGRPFPSPGGASEETK